MIKQLTKMDKKEQIREILENYAYCSGGRALVDSEDFNEIIENILALSQPKEVEPQKPIESERITSKEDFEEFFFIIKDLRLNDTETEDKIKSIYNISKKTNSNN